jgi:FixJ family two-component response regulator
VSARAAKAATSTIPVLFISGTPRLWWTSRDVSNFKLFPPVSVDFIEKPFSGSQLLTKVGELIRRTRTITSKWFDLRQKRNVS